MEDLGSIAEFAAVGSLYLGFAVAAVAFAIRVIRRIEARGRADRRTVWRLALLRALAAILGLSGGLIFAEMSWLVLAGLDDMPWVALMGDESRRWHRRLGMAVFSAFMLSSFGLILLVEPREMTAAWRSFPILRWLSVRSRLAGSIVRRWPPVANTRSFLRRHNRRLW